MAGKIGIAVIGAGARGKVYSNAWKQIKEAELISICDILEERASYCLEEFGYKDKFFSFKEAIDLAEVDVVTVCVPAYLHPVVSIYAMEKGKHVISEKPMALSLSKAEQMIKTGKEMNVQLALGFQYRNFAPIRKAKKAIEKGLLGRPVLGLANDIRPIRIEVGKPAMHNAAEGNGGPVTDVLCHYNDLMRWFFQTEPIRVNAKNFTYGKDKPELASVKQLAPDTATIQIEYEAGDVLNLVLSWGLPLGQHAGELNYFNALGPLGVLNNIGGQMELSKEELEESRIPELTVINHLLAAIQGEGVPQAGGYDGYVSLATSLAAIKSARQGRAVTLDEIYREKPDLIDLIDK